VQQWSLAVVQRVLGDDAARLGVDAAVGFGTGVVLLTVVTVGATVWAGRRLQTIRLSEDS
jgi:ABC-2 type transport system permease protein